jgi:hypothetical protein
MADWTQERIAWENGNYSDCDVTLDGHEYHQLLTLAARGMAAEQDAVKARALEEWAEAVRAYNSVRGNARERSSLHGRALAASNAAFALCPASTKETAT